MKFSLNNSELSTTAGDMVAVAVFQDTQGQGALFQQLDRALGGLLGQLAAEEDFTGKKDQTLLVHTSTQLPQARVLLVGAHLDDPAYTGLLEETGTLVVRDAYCCGLRDQLEPVEENTATDPFEALAQRYLNRLSCPRMYDDYPRRLERIVHMAETAAMDGIILEHLKFCETWGIDGNVLLQDLRERGFPVLRLEREYRLSGEGQTRTRVQAFLESIGK